MPTPNYNFTYLSAGQTNKESAINQNLDYIDALCAPVVGLVGKNTHLHTIPPVTPLTNRIYLTSSTPSGIFGGFPDQIAIFTTLGWLFFAPSTSQIFFDEEGASIRRFGSSWIAGTGGGSNVNIFHNPVNLTSTILSDYYTGQSIIVNASSTITIDNLIPNFSAYEIKLTAGTLTLTAGIGITLIGTTSFSTFTVIRIYRVNNDVYILPF
jgi:hypothetical protein